MNERRRALMLLSMTLVVGLSMTGCANPPSAAGTPTPSESIARNDERLIAAAELIRPRLARSYPAEFAGLVLDHPRSMMIVYRKPQPSLDAFVQAEVPNVNVVMRDASFSLVQMTDLAEKIVDDQEFWRGKGISINGATPKPDGSGVEVMTSAGGQNEQRQLAERYPTMPISVRQATVAPPIGSPLPPMRVTTEPPAKSPLPG